MRLIQFAAADGTRAVAAIEGASAPRVVLGAASVRELALEAHRIEALARGKRPLRADSATPSTTTALIAEKRILLPLDHPGAVAHRRGAHRPDASRQRAVAQFDARQAAERRPHRFHEDVQARPGRRQAGSRARSACSRNGPTRATAHGWSRPSSRSSCRAMPRTAARKGRSPGLYVIGDHGEVLRVGFALGNEYSDHVMERRNYLYLAHSKLRQSSFGPEVLIGELPNEVKGTVRIVRDGKDAWQGELLSGEANMCHSIANLEQHHFKYAGFRRPGDVHIYFYGASALSTAAGFETEPGDVFEVEAPVFGRPLRNPLVARGRRRSPIPFSSSDRFPRRGSNDRTAPQSHRRRMGGRRGRDGKHQPLQHRRGGRPLRARLEGRHRARHRRGEGRRRRPGRASTSTRATRS